MSKGMKLFKNSQSIFLPFLPVGEGAVGAELAQVGLTAWSVLHFPHTHIPPYIRGDNTPFCASAAVIVATVPKCL